jgi:hypothetical protein
VRGRGAGRREVPWLGQPGRGWGALEGQHQGPEQISGLLAQGGEVGADRGEVLGPRVRAEAAADLLLEFGHSDIPLCQERT